jgi:hypothetical protein
MSWKKTKKKSDLWLGDPYEAEASSHLDTGISAQRSVNCTGRSAQGSGRDRGLKLPHPNLTTDTPIVQQPKQPSRDNSHSIRVFTELGKTRQRVRT